MGEVVGGRHPLHPPSPPSLPPLPLSPLSYVAIEVSLQMHSTFTSFMVPKNLPRKPPPPP